MRTCHRAPWIVEQLHSGSLAWSRLACAGHHSKQTQPFSESAPYNGFPPSLRLEIS